MEPFIAGFFRAPPRAPATAFLAAQGRPRPCVPLFLGRRPRRSSSSVVCMAEPYLIAKLDSAEKAWKEMSVRLADPDIVSDPSEYQKLAQSVVELDQVVTTYRQFKDCEKQLEETQDDEALGDEETDGSEYEDKFEDTFEDEEEHDAALNGDE